MSSYGCSSESSSEYRMNLTTLTVAGLCKIILLLEMAGYILATRLLDKPKENQCSMKNIRGNSLIIL